MSIAQEYEAHNVKISPSTKKVYILSRAGFKGIFTYDLHCETMIGNGHLHIHMFFCVSNNKGLIVFGNRGEYKCVEMSFHITANNRPLLAVSYFMEQEAVIDKIEEQFKTQYADYIVDQTINS